MVDRAGGRVVPYPPPRLYGPYKKDIGELEPEAVTRTLIHALETKHPRPRYAVTYPTRLFMFLKRILPGDWLDYIVLSVMGLSPPSKLHP